MPASRRARAITLAPRSCPSRPGFATRTRIFISGIGPHLITEDARLHRAARNDLRLEGLDVEAPPHVPASYAAVGFPSTGDLFHILRLRQFAFLVMLLHGYLDTIVTGRQYIRPAQGKNQKHVRRPDSDA